MGTKMIPSGIYEKPAFEIGSSADFEEYMARLELPDPGVVCNNGVTRALLIRWRKAKSPHGEVNEDLK